MPTSKNLGSNRNEASRITIDPQDTPDRILFLTVALSRSVTVRSRYLVTRLSSIINPSLIL
jgi:hypothetical protein